MSNRPSRDEERTLQQSIIDFLSKYRVLLLVVLGVIVIGVVGSFLYLEISDRRAAAAAELADDLETSYQEWGELEEGERGDKEEEIRTTAGEILDRYPRTFAGQRAHFVLGSLSFEKEEYDEATEHFVTLAENFPESYLAPVARFNAAVSQEEAGNDDNARSHYLSVVENHAGTSAQVPRALFALGRLSESGDSYEDAAGYYNRILDEYGDSSWTTLARNRIIFLQTEELITESS